MAYETHLEITIPSINALIDRRQLLQAEIAGVDAEISEIKGRARTEAIARANEILKEHGLSFVAEQPKPPRAARVKAEAKYRDPASGKTWSGRGRKPGWLPNAVHVNGAKNAAAAA